MSGIVYALIWLAALGAVVLFGSRVLGRVGARAASAI